MRDFCTASILHQLLFAGFDSPANKLEDVGNVITSDKDYVSTILNVNDKSSC